MLGESPRLRLYPENTALLVIDVQMALFSRPTSIYKADVLIRNINSLVEMFQLSNALVVFIQHSNNKMLIKDSDGWQFHPDLNFNEDDPIIHKIHGNAFKETNLKQVLESRGIEDIVITGLVTQGCVKATSIGGNELGYRVILIEDGHSNYSKEAPKIIEKWNLKLGKEQVELFSADEICFV
jgi:nicotinamidase-related amidase